MHKLQGIPVSPGYAEGTALVYEYEIQQRLKIPRYDVPHAEIDQEHRRVTEAADQSRRELQQAEASARSASGSEPVEAEDILSAHSQLVHEVAERIKQHIERERVSAEQSLEAVIEAVVRQLRALEHAGLREQEQDIRDVGFRMLRHLRGAEASLPAASPRNSVIVARELLPSQAVELIQSGAVALATELGSTNSHTAILARSFGIPAVSGLEAVTEEVRSGSRLMVDGLSGTVTIDPSTRELQHFSTQKQEYADSMAAALAGEHEPCVTSDQVCVSLLANIGRPEEADHIRLHHLDGVGLFRTEFLFMEAHQPPDFEIQFQVYDRIAERLEGQSIVIRTFDLGGEKIPPFLSSPGDEPTSRLVPRGLRFSLDERTMLDTQLRAIVRTAQGRDVRVLFPMVTGGDDFARACEALDDATHALGLTQRPQVGAMIETPAALFALEEILELADFLAIGTNDLTQYMLGVERDAADMLAECTPLHPSVLRAIRSVIVAARAKGCPVSVCGEEAGRPDVACLLAGLGIRELSMSAPRAAHVRQALRSVSCAEMEQLAAQALRSQSPEEVRRLLAECQLPSS